MEVRVLGPLELADGAAVIALPPSERSLLAALAARLGARVPVAVLTHALWPDDPPASARKTLQGKVLRLRRGLGAGAIVEIGGSYRLDPDHVEVDADRVAALVADGRDAARRQDWDHAVAVLTSARAAFRGEPYDGVAETALPPGEVERLCELREASFEELVDAELGRRCGAHWIGELEAFVQRHPYRERAWGLLMRALYEAGRPADALDAYSRVRLVLARDLGLEPGPALHELERAVLTHATDLTARAAQATGVGPANVPAAVSPIVGRERELAADPAAHDRAADHAHRRGWDRQDPPRPRARVPARRSRRVGPAVRRPGRDRRSGARPGPDRERARRRRRGRRRPARRRRPRAAGHRRGLIVVDNCEHLLPEIAAAVGRLLAVGPGIRVLATSRGSLGVGGERVCPLGPLSVPGPDADSDDAVRCDAAVLFVARLPVDLAASTRGEVERAAVADICRRLDGIPLGLELAAASCRTLSLPGVASRLETSIGELTPTRHGTVPRHRTMRAALDWGYALLSMPARTSLQAMSVFVGGCDLAAFEAVCVDRAREQPDVLDELVRTSFVTVATTGLGSRYRLLEPVRQYAAELLAANGAATTRHRHLQHCLERACALTSGVDQIGVDTQWDELRPELGNFRAALDWAVDDDAAAAPGLQLAARLWDVWASDGHAREGLTRIVALLDRGSGTAAVRSHAAFAAGFLAANVLGDDARGLSLWERALTEASAGHDAHGEARVRRVLATCAFVRGDVATARAHLETAITASRADADELLHAQCEVALAELEHWTGELDAAAARSAAVLDGPLAAVGSIGASAHLVLAAILVDQGDHAAAHAAAQRVVELAADHSMLHLSIEAHLALAEIGVACRDLEQVTIHLARAEALSPEAASGWDGWFVQLRAEMALLDGRASAARELAAAALDAVADEGGLANRCSPLGLLGRTLLAGERPELALERFEELIAIAGVAPFPCRQADGHEGAAAAALALGRAEQAADHVAMAAELRRRTGSRPTPRAVVDERLAAFAAVASVGVTRLPTAARPGGAVPAT